MSGERQTTTAEDLLHQPGDGFRYEVVRGELRRMSPAGFRHGAVAARLGAAVEAFVGARDLGVVLAAETGFALAREPDTVRAPDLAFVKRDRLPAELPAGYFPGAPDLAVEVVSPTDRFADLQDKVRDWLRAGCRLVWVVEPEGRTVAVYDSEQRGELLGENEVLDGGQVLRGFAVPVGWLFDKP